MSNPADVEATPLPEQGVGSASRDRAGKAVRDLAHALVGHEASDEQIVQLAVDLESWTSMLSEGPLRRRDTRTFQRSDAWNAPPPGELFVTNHGDRPVSGPSSPFSLDPVVRRVGDEVEATVTLRSAHEGAPERSHGGIVAALFDDIYGYLLPINQTPAFTGELTVRYERGTPLHVPLTCRVRLDRQEGRKLFMTGELCESDGTVCVRSTATFITLDTAKVPGWGDGV